MRKVSIAAYWFRQLLLSHNTKPLAEAMLIILSGVLWHSPSDQFHRKGTKHQFLKCVWKIHFWNYFHICLKGGDQRTHITLIWTPYTKAVWFRAQEYWFHSWTKGDHNRCSEMSRRSPSVHVCPMIYSHKVGVQHFVAVEHLIIFMWYVY